VQVVFDTLLLRTRLREHRTREHRAELDIKLTPQVLYHAYHLYDPFPPRSNAPPRTSSQSLARSFDRKHIPPGEEGGDRTISVESMADSGPSSVDPTTLQHHLHHLHHLHHQSSTYHVSRDDISDVECAPVGQHGIQYEYSYAHHLGEV